MVNEMDQLQRFQRLAKHAREEERPPIDVSGRVLGTIRSRLFAFGMSKPLWIMAAAAATVALIVAFTAMGISGTPTSDPLNDLLGPLTMAIQ